MAEYDVHFNLQGFFRKIEATSPEKAKEIAEEWLTAALPSLEAAARVGLSIEITDSISDEVTEKLNSVYSNKNNQPTLGYMKKIKKLQCRAIKNTSRT